MDIKIISSSGSEMRFMLEDSNPAFANALRRIMRSEIPTMAIEYVDMEENNSGLFDEIVAHRLGLMPIAFDQKAFNLKDECKCKGAGCTNCEAVFVLEKDGPCVVRAGDMVCAAEGVKVIDPRMPITELLEGQRLKFEAVAQLGFGKNHIKWQAANVGYRNSASIRIYNDKDSEIKKIVKICPVNVFDEKGGDVKASRPEDCTLCMRCVDITEKGAVSVTADESSFIFEVESVSGLSPRQILETSLDTLEKRAEEFVSEAKKTIK
ncbi:MAG TPA: DNA-directed RNA polymerase subunit D [archaeon]|nr:DNA-directed RNA polymerase subunit D [archaeon]